MPRLLAVAFAAALVAPACSGSEPADPVSESPSPTATTTAVDPVISDSAAATLAGEPLAQAPVRHVEGDPVVGDVAPTLQTGEVTVPADRPTLLLTVVGSCADCVEAAANLAPLAEELGAQAVLVSTDPPEGALTAPWHLIVDEAAARAFSGRDRPTALVIGTDGVVLSRVRPFNQTGATYDLVDLRFGLEVAQNAMVASRPADATELEDREVTDAADRPDRFVAITIDGRAVEVDTATGSVVDEFALEASGDAHEIMPIRDGEFQLVLTCCAPDAEAYVLDRSQPAGGIAEVRFRSWEIAVDSTGDRVAITAGSRRVEPVAGQVAEGLAQPLSLGGSNGSSPAVEWLRNGDGVVYLHRGNSMGVVEVVRFAGSGGAPVERSSFALDEAAVDLAIDDRGHILVAVSAFGGEATEAVVHDPSSGEVVDRFPLPDATTHIDTDATGRFLLTVDESGVARWRSDTDSGELGSGFHTANW